MSTLLNTSPQEVSWYQPKLTSNIPLGTGNFSVDMYHVYSGSAYQLFDGNASTNCYLDYDSYVTMYSKTPIKIRSINVTYTTNSTLNVERIASCDIYVSNDGAQWTFIRHVETSNTSQYTTWTEINPLPVSSPHYYNYYKVCNITPFSGSNKWFCEWTIDAVCLDDLPDYYNAWAAPCEHKWYIRY